MYSGPNEQTNRSILVPHLTLRSGAMQYMCAAEEKRFGHARLKALVVVDAM